MLTIILSSEILFKDSSLINLDAYMLRRKIGYMMNWLKSSENWQGLTCSDLESGNRSPLFH